MLLKSSTQGNRSWSSGLRTLQQIKEQVPAMLKLSDSIHIAKLGQHAHRLTGAEALEEGGEMSS
jgi:hypothetical protein